jgi:hypothetical protein
MSENTTVTPETEATPVKEKRKRTDYGLTDEQFVEAWQSSQTVDEAADKMSKVAGCTVPKPIIHARASVYRSKGVNLKKMDRRNPSKLDVDRLNERIAEVNKKQEKPTD